MRAGLEAGLAEVDERVRRPPGLAHDLARTPVPQASWASSSERYGDGPRRPVARRELPALLPGAARPGRDLLPRRAGGAAVAGPPAGVPRAAQGAGRGGRRRSIIATHSPILLAVPGRRRSGRSTATPIRPVALRGPGARDADPRLPRQPRGVPAPPVAPEAAASAPGGTARERLVDAHLEGVVARRDVRPQRPVERQ